MPCALTGVVTGAVVSTATAAATTKAIFIIAASSLCLIQGNNGDEHGRFHFRFRCYVSSRRARRSRYKSERLSCAFPKHPDSLGAGEQVTLVAGARSHLYRTRTQWR